MKRSTLLILLLVLLLFGCNSPAGPKQVLVFKASPGPGNNAIDVKQATPVIRSRLRSAGLKRQFQVKESESAKLEVITYGADEADLEKIKKCVTAQATLEFAPIADSKRWEKLAAAAKDVVGEVQMDGVVCGAWFPAADGIVPNPPAETTFGERMPDEGLVGREREVDGKTLREWLVAYDPECRVTGAHLSSAELAIDSRGAPALSFRLRSDEAWRMSEMTSQLRPYRNKVWHLAIIWNGAIISAPIVQSQINSQGMITGDFTKDEVKEMAALLGSGQLPCQFEFEKLTTDEP